MSMFSEMLWFSSCDTLKINLTSEIEMNFGSEQEVGLCRLRDWCNLNESVYL